jgi:CDGSH-type Zn-finger protein
MSARRDAMLRGALAGPRLVRGLGFVVAADGTAVQAQRPVVALCRCDATARGPWCDGTHKLIARRAAADPTH